MRVVLDALRMQERQEAHAYLKEELGFPDYYGRNLDALYDCLTDLGSMELVVVNQEQAGGYFPSVCKVLRRAAKDSPALRIESGREEKEGAG